MVRKDIICDRCGKIISSSNDTYFFKLRKALYNIFFDGYFNDQFYGKYDICRECMLDFKNNWMKMKGEANAETTS